MKQYRTSWIWEKLTVPAKSNQIIRNAVTESGEKYLNGETGLDDAVKEIMQEVNLYLSE